MIARRAFLVVTGTSIGGWAIGSSVFAMPALSSTPSIRPTSTPSVATTTTVRADAIEPQPDESLPDDEPTLAIFDPARAAGQRFADDATQRGHIVLPLEGDAGIFWYRTVLPSLARSSDIGRPPALHGLTSHADFFILSTLAASAGMTVSRDRLPFDAFTAPHDPLTNSIAHLPPPHVVWRCACST
jgi:hypothetical protein